MTPVNLAAKFAQIQDYWSPKVAGELKGNRVKGIKAAPNSERVGVFYSREDLSGGLVGEPVDGLVGYDPATATAILRNILLYASVDGDVAKLAELVRATHGQHFEIASGNFAATLPATTFGLPTGPTPLSRRTLVRSPGLAGVGNGMSRAINAAMPSTSPAKLSPRNDGGCSFTGNVVMST